MVHTEEEKKGFIDYLENDLIPDLLKNGGYNTAQDFKTCVKFMKGVRKKPCKCIVKVEKKK